MAPAGPKREASKKAGTLFLWACSAYAGAREASLGVRGAVCKRASPGLKEAGKRLFTENESRHSLKKSQIEFPACSAGPSGKSYETTLSRCCRAPSC